MFIPNIVPEPIFMTTAARWIRRIILIRNPSFLFKINGDREVSKYAIQNRYK